MPATVPSHLQVADELAARMLTSADAGAEAEIPPEVRTPAAYHLARLRFAARVVRELGFQLDRIAQEARQAGAEDAQVADARADRSPPELRAGREGPIDA